MLIPGSLYSINDNKDVFLEKILSATKNNIFLCISVKKLTKDYQFNTWYAVSFLDDKNKIIVLDFRGHELQEFFKKIE
jgi:hypothetical protein